MRRLAAVLFVLAAAACSPEAPAPAVPVPSGEPGVVNLIGDETSTPAPNEVPGAGVEYGKYAPGR